MCFWMQSKSLFYPCPFKGSPSLLEYTCYCLTTQLYHQEKKVSLIFLMSSAVWSISNDVPFSSLFFDSHKRRRCLWLHFISHLSICLQDTHTSPWWVLLEFSIRWTLVRVHKWTLLAVGKVVTGYRVRNGEWTLIGRQSPQLPQVCFCIEFGIYWLLYHSENLLDEESLLL